MLMTSRSTRTLFSVYIILLHVFMFSHAFGARRPSRPPSRKWRRRFDAGRRIILGNHTSPRPRRLDHARVAIDAIDAIIDLSRVVRSRRAPSRRRGRRASSQLSLRKHRRRRLAVDARVARASRHRTLAPRLDRRHESVPVRETRDDVDVRDRDRGRRGERARVSPRPRTREISRLMACSLGEPATTLVVFEEGCVGDWSTFMDGAVREAEVMCEEMTDGEVDGGGVSSAGGVDGESACGNYTSRSPLPTVHLLRAVDVDRAETSWYRDEDREDIRERNVEYLSALGLTELKRSDCTRLSGETRRDDATRCDAWGIEARLTSASTVHIHCELTMRAHVD